MPAVYKKGDFDLAGFAVGVIERKRIITGERIRSGDTVIGLASSGVHSNGYSLVRKLFFEQGKYKPSSKISGLGGSLGSELLEPTRIYVKPILALLDNQPGIIKGMAHITGGGLPGNVPRVLPRGCKAIIDKSAWKVPPIFRVMQSLGVAEKEMYDVFNMGIGMALVVRSKDASDVVAHFKRKKIPAYVIGEITKGRRGAVLG
jgi:phosphoribosylformylglycinamidine cyclo-ligase